MNKKELAIELTRREPGMSEAAAGRAIEAVFGAINGALAEKQTVTLKGFGVFSVRGRKARTFRNPNTGATVQVGDRRTVHFKPSLRIKEAVN